MTPAINKALPSHITQLREARILPPPAHTFFASTHRTFDVQSTEYALAMSSRLTDRTEPTVIPRAHASTRSRLPSILRIPILLVLNLGLKSALWSFVSNFLNPELGAISKVPSEADFWSLYSPGARLIMNGATFWMNWYLNYDCKRRSKLKGLDFANAHSL
jgi:hypothetical protein